MHERTGTSTPRGAGVVGRKGAGLVVLAIVVGVVVATQSGAAKVKVRTDFDKAFDFSQARTWGWNPQEMGRVVLARTPSDDPDLVRQRAEPVLRDAVNAEMPRRGLTLASGTPDLALTYFLLLTVGTSTQTLGQFLPAVTAWGVPPFPQSTTSFNVIEQGSLVLDLSANGRVVWRGIGEAQIKMDLDLEKRAALIREAVREILRSFPPKR